jgi:hypothetical protein
LLISPEGWLINLTEIEEAEKGQLTEPSWCFVKTQFGFNWLKNAQGLKKADMLILIGVTFNNLQERVQHVHEFTLPCVRGSRL